MGSNPTKDNLFNSIIQFFYFMLKNLSLKPMWAILCRINNKIKTKNNNNNNTVICIYFNLFLEKSITTYI